MIVDIPFNGSHAESQSRATNSQMSVNIYPEKQGDGAKVPTVMHPTPALSFKLSAGTGPCRCNGVVFSGKAYFVSGSDLVEIGSNFVGTSVGTLSTNSGRVSMSSNPTQLMIADGTNGYIWDGTTLTVISDADYVNGKHVTFMDTFFVIEDPDNVGRFVKSAGNDGLSYDPLEFATAESSPDDMIIPLSIQNSILMFGEYTTEVYANTGSKDFPFSATRGSKMEIGIQAEWSAIQAGSFMYWIGQTKQGGNIVYESNGFQHKVISTREIEYEIGTYLSVTDCDSFSYQQHGHTFIQFNFPAADRTLVYDATERAWHRRKGYKLGRHRATGQVYFNGVNLVGDYSNSNFYSLDTSIYEDNGVTIERIRTAGYVHKQRKNVFIHRLEIEFERGVGLTSGQGEDPKVFLEVSKDGGNTWGNKLIRTIGKKGEYKNRAVWSKLGKARDWLFRLTITDPVDYHIIKATARIIEGEH